MFSLVLIQEAQLEKRASAWCIHLIMVLLSGICFFEFSYTLRVGYLGDLPHSTWQRTHESLQE